jgi:hypothetical protein
VWNELKPRRGERERGIYRVMGDEILFFMIFSFLALQ